MWKRQKIQEMLREVINVLAQTEKDIEDAIRRVEKIKEYL